MTINMSPHEAASLIQTSYRSFQFRKKWAGGFVEEAKIREFVNSISYPLKFPAVAPDGDLFSIDPIKAKEWVALHIPEKQPLAQKFIQSIIRKNHQQFLGRLKVTIDAFQKKIALLPLKARDFILVIPDESQTKSNSWVNSLALSHFNYRLPLDVVEINRYQDEKSKELIRKYSHVKNIVYLDDAAYSGDQAANFMGALFNYVGPDVQVHAVIPYMTKAACERIRKVSSRVLITEHERMLSVSNMGVFPHDSIRTLTLFNHKLPDHRSTYEAQLKAGDLLDGNQELGKRFIKGWTPPYKLF